MINKDIKIEVMEFQKEFKSVNLEMMKNNPKDYDMAIIIIHIEELDSGYIVKKIGKTYKKGTKVTYKPCTNENEAEEYGKKINKLVNSYNEKYETNYNLKVS